MPPVHIPGSSSSSLPSRSDSSPVSERETTARLARTEAASRAAPDAVLVGAGVPSLIAVIFTLGQAGNAGAPGRGLLTGLGLVSVALAWTSVHTVYLLRYARLYYSPPDGG